MRKEVLLVVSLFLVVFMSGFGSAEIINFNAYNNIPAHESLNITNFDYQSFIPIIHIEGDIWYIDEVQFNLSDYKRGRYSFLFASEEFPSDMFENITEGFYLTKQRDRTSIFFIDEEDNQYFGFFGGITKINHLQNGYHKVQIAGNYDLFDEDGNENKGTLDILFFLDDNNQVVDSITQINMNGFIIDTEPRVSGLESWQQTINDWKITVTDTLTNIISDITSLFSTTDDHEIRITNLESQEPGEQNLTFSEYWKYLDFRTKEDIACGWGEDNDLDLFKMQDLGASCENDGRRCGCEEVRGECDLESPLYCYSWELRRDDLNLEIKNLASEDLEIESIEVGGCDVYDRSYRLREGRDARFRIDCLESFEEGEIEVRYVDESEETHFVNGEINLQ
ncbi:MAG: hypothetical protein ABH864_05250 [archaeon]